jgi:hypothetical protein
VAREAGRRLLAEALAAHQAHLWEGREVVRFAVDCRTPEGEVHVALAVDPASRSAEVVADRGARGAFVYDGATGRLAPTGDVTPDPGVEKQLRTLVPSIVFWAMVPRVLDDSSALVWRTGRERRLAVRWPGERDWFLFDADSSGALRSVEFIDSRFSPLFRWRGVREETARVEGVALPARWRFRAANPVLNALLGGRDLHVLRYGPVS